MLSACTPGVVKHNVFAQSRGYAAFQGTGSPTSFALNDFWGDSTGPLHHLENPEGLGDSVEDHVSVTPWEADTNFLAANERLTIPGPLDFLIGDAYPNPFNSEITIEYVVTKPQPVTLEIFDVLGRRVITLELGMKATGIYHAVWHPDHEASGIYFARLDADGSPQRAWLKKLVLLK